MLQIQIPLVESEYAKITSVKINIICKVNPDHSWGIYLKDDGTLPESWDICIKCSTEKRKGKGKVENGYETHVGSQHI